MAMSRPCQTLFHARALAYATVKHREAPALFAPPPMNEYPPAASPVMAQYLEIKRANPSCLLFFRMGDFFELFFDDAVAAAQALDIALTKRGRHDGAEIPMCGVPAPAAAASRTHATRGRWCYPCTITTSPQINPLLFSHSLMFSFSL